MNKQRMPTTRMLTGASWLALICACALACGFAIQGSWAIAGLVRAFFVLAAGLIFSIALRMAANIGQMLFEVRTLFYQGLQDARDARGCAEGWRADIRTQFSGELQALRGESSSTTQAVREVAEELRFLRSQVEKLSCDCQDINQDIFQIRVFFERIESRLALKD